MAWVFGGISEELIVRGIVLKSIELCHSLYDTIAFVRFANKKSKYSDLVKD